MRRLAAAPFELPASELPASELPPSESLPELPTELPTEGAVGIAIKIVGAALALEKLARVVHQRDTGSGKIADRSGFGDVDAQRSVAPSSRSAPSLREILIGSTRLVVAQRRAVPAPAGP